MKSLAFYYSFSVLFLFVSHECCSALPIPLIGTVDGAYNTLSRALQLDARTAFSISLDSTLKCSIIKSATPLQVEAPSAVDAVAIVAQFVRETYNASFSWSTTGGSSLGSLPHTGPLTPPIDGSFVLCRTVNFTYYQNVVQSSYSNVWWNVTRWTEEVDWMALHGINLALAYGGQEALFRNVYLSLGLTDEQLGTFFNGPAFLSWSRGQGMAGVGGPLPLWWYDSQLSLNKAVVDLMLSLGIQPILPIFQGNVPMPLTILFPHANISSNGWLDVFDPLFTIIQDKYIIELQKAYYTSSIQNNSLHWYEGDGLFMAGTPPWRDGGSIGGSLYSTNESISPPPPDPNALARSTAAYNSFAKHDKEAVWVYQSWIWRGFSSTADFSYLTGWLQGAPIGNLFLLDQTAERIPIWQKFNNFSFNGQPFAWLSMNNMGGNVGLIGSLQWLSDGFRGALQNSNGAISGIGMDPEGINTMPAYWEYLLSLSWDRNINISQMDFLGDYGIRRCGKEGVNGIKEAYSLLTETVFSSNQSNFEHHLIYCGTAMPLKGSGNSWDKESEMIRATWYTANQLATIWNLLNNAAPLCDFPVTYDLVDIAREYISVFPCVAAHDALNSATTLQALSTANSSIVSILNDLDNLLGTMFGFLTGSWINDSRNLGFENKGTVTDILLLEWNARSQISTWYPLPPTPDNHLYDYANKQWSGITRDYYLQRYILLANRIETAINTGTKVDTTAYMNDLGTLGEEFTRATNASYPIIPQGDAKSLCKSLYQKYAVTV